MEPFINQLEMFLQIWKKIKRSGMFENEVEGIFRRNFLLNII